MPLKAAAFYKAFLSLNGAIATAFLVLPYVAEILPERISPYLFPLLSNVEGIARLGAVVFPGLATYVVFIYAREYPVAKIRKPTLIFFLTSLVLFLFYVAASHRFVKAVAVPSEHRSITVSIGYERTEFARETFPSSTDIEMLHDRGTTEEDIERLWTARSLLYARLMLYISYLGCMMAIISVLSLGAIREASEP